MLVDAVRRGLDAMIQAAPPGAHCARGVRTARQIRSIGSAAWTFFHPKATLRSAGAALAQRKLIDHIGLADPPPRVDQSALRRWVACACLCACACECMSLRVRACVDACAVVMCMCVRARQHA